MALDVTDRDAAFDAVRRAHEHFGRLDIVVNNAGYGQFGMVEEISEQEARDQIETNLFGALWVTQAALPFLREQGSGHFLQVSSIGGISAFAGIGMYHASKWALEGLSQALAQEVKGFGIHVTLIEPGGFSTDWGGVVGAQRAAAGRLRRDARGVAAAAGRGASAAGRSDRLGAGHHARGRRRPAPAARLLRPRAARHRRAGLRRPAGDLARVAAGRRDRAGPRTRGQRRVPCHATAPQRPAAVVLLVAVASLTLAGNSSGTPSDAAASAGCVRTKHKAKVSAPRFVRHIATGETGWFASPGLVDLNGDGKLEIVAPVLLDLRLRRAGARRSARGRRRRGGSTRRSVVADLDGDKVPEIVVGGNEGTVAAYDLVGGAAAAQARLAGVDVQRRPVPRGARHGRGRPRRRRPRSRSWSRRRTRRRPDRRCSSSTPRARCTGRPARRRRRGRATTR